MQQSVYDAICSEQGESTFKETRLRLCCANSSILSDDSAADYTIENISEGSNKIPCLEAMIQYICSTHWLEIFKKMFLN